MSSADGYARGELLAEPDWLWERRDDPNLRIVDCGDPAGYARAHIPCGWWGTRRPGRGCRGPG